jgi:hypothetical protein
MPFPPQVLACQAGPTRHLAHHCCNISKAISQVAYKTRLHAMSQSDRIHIGIGKNQNEAGILE